MMKKVQKLLTLGLCLALGAGALVACGNKGGGSGDGYAEGDLTDYYIVGTIKGGYATDANWNEKDAEGNSLVTDAIRFVRSAESGVYTLTLDLWKENQFKIRYIGRGWDDEGGQLNASNNFDEENNGDTTNGIAGEQGDGLGGKNFECYKEGQYTVTINANGDVPMVTWVRDGDATEKAPILATDVTLKDAESQVVSSITLTVGETLQLAATVTPDTTTNKAVTYTSSNTDCFTVSATGLVTAVAVPEAEGDEEPEELELYVNVGSQIALKTVSVTILPAGTQIVQPESIAIPQNEKAQKKHVGDAITVNPTILPADTTNKTVAYTMTDTSGAITISGTTITAVKPTTAPITITATVGSGANAKTDTFTVEVVKDYYLRGIGSWDATATVGDPNYVFLTETSAGIYTATDVTIAKNAEFMITHVGTVTGPMDWEEGRIDNTALDNATIAAGKIIAKADGSNIQCTDTAKYTITLNLTGASPVVSAELTEDLPESEPVYYLVGDSKEDPKNANDSAKLHAWGATDITSEALAGDSLMNKDSTGHYSITITFEGAVEFQFCNVGAGWAGQIGATGGGNINLDAGTWTITLDVTGDAPVITTTAA